MIKIEDKTKCCGCGACIQICPKKCIRLQTDNEGFWYPKVNEEICIDCNLCNQICPEINPGCKGEHYAAYGAVNINPLVVDQTTSGGVFSEIANYILKEGGIVYGATFDDNWNVIHDYDEDLPDKFYGSKYVESHIGDIFIKIKQDLNDGRKVLFSGTPCQTRGLKNFLLKTYDNLLTVDFICHGVPSPLLWQYYLKNWHDDPSFKLNKKEKELYSNESKYRIDQIKFRDKINGCSAFSLSLSPLQPSLNPVKVAAVKKENLYMRAFLRNISLRPSCYRCSFKEINSGSDITLGDFWGVQNLKTDIDVKNGINAVIINTEKGLNIFSRLNLNMFKCSISDIIRHNPSLYKSVEKPRDRETFYKKIYSSNEPIKVFKQFSKAPISEIIRWQLIKIFKMIGILKLLKRTSI